MIVDPVFVDRSGRRRRLLVGAGLAGGVLLVTAVVALLAGFTGPGEAGLPGWPAATGRAAVPKSRAAVPATTRARPAATVTRPAAPPPTSASPSTSATPSVSATPSASASAHPRNHAHSPGARPSKKK
ncbi:hypothetical protein ACQPZX_27165 [Actinoplanes sp. CA-142083]|uniref:hypothetical protein n=1 Tax=Actinoplanes sp. CA-142083 TaxID=3239903 RepID=UPI003D94217D